MALSSATFQIDIQGAAQGASSTKNFADQLQRAADNEKRLNERLIQQRTELARINQQIKENNILQKQAITDKINGAQIAANLAQETKALKQNAIQKREQIGLTRLGIAESKNEARAAVQAQAAHEKAVKIAQRNEQLAYQNSLVGKLGHSWDKFAMIFERVAFALGAFVIIDKITRSIRFLANSLIESNQLFDILKARLSAFYPTAEKLTGVWEKLVQITITTPFTLDEVVSSAALLEAYGVKTEKHFQAIADWATATDRDLKDAAISFGKITSFSPRTGMLLSTRGLTMAGFETFYARTGDRSKALADLIDATYGNMAQKVSRTFEGLQSNISDVWTQIAQKTGEPLFEAMKEDLRAIYDILTLIKNSGSGPTGDVFAGLYEGLKKMAQYTNPVTMIIGAELRALNDLQKKNLLGNVDRDLMSPEKTVFQIEQLLAAKKEILSDMGIGGERMKWLERDIASNKELVEAERLRLVVTNMRLNALMDIDALQKVEKGDLKDVIKLWKDSLAGKSGTSVTAAGVLFGDLAKGFDLERAKAALIDLGKQATADFASIQKPSIAEGLRFKQTIEELLKSWLDLSNGLKNSERDWDNYIQKLVTMRKGFADLRTELEKKTDLLSGNYQKSLSARLESSMTLIGGREDSKNSLMGRISEISKNLKSKDGLFNLKNATEIVDYWVKINAEIKTSADLIEELSKVSTDFGDAWVRAARSSREQLARWRDELAQSIAEGIKRLSISGIESGMQAIFGIKSDRWEQLTDQIDDLRFQLLELEAQKNNIQLIDAQEESLLSRIADLERQRADTWISWLSQGIEPVYEKLKELAASEIIDKIFPDASEESTYKMFEELKKVLANLGDLMPTVDQAMTMMALEQSIATLKMNGGAELVKAAEADLGLAIARLSVEAQIAALKGGSSLSPDAEIMPDIPLFRSPYDNEIVSPTKYRSAGPQVRYSPAPSSGGGKTTVLQIIGPVYGMDDFENKIDKTLKRLSENTR